jgi:signal transduction histidine kinase/ligand-binding sensor domain-containing protein
MICRLLLLFFTGLLSAVLSEAQEYRFRLYRVEQGLPSDVIKAVTQDSLGFLWIATDDGLVKYDGLRFTTYKSALQSQYTKGFLHTRNGRLLAYGDLDLIEVQNLVDTVIFKSLLHGTRNPTDSTIWYPKSAYEDREGNIWLAEPQSVVLYNGKMKRFDFGTAYRSPIFSRSFHFFEDPERNLYAIAYQGNVFRYNPARKNFEPLQRALPSGVNAIQVVKEDVWIAAQDGFYRTRFEGGEIKKIEMILPVPNASHLVMSPDSTWWISTFDDDLYRFQRDLKLETLLHNFNGINSSYYSKEGDLWVATDKGIVLVQKNQFVLADLNSQTHFVEGIAYDHARDALYYCYKEILIRLNHAIDGTWQSNIIYNDAASYFQSLQVGRRGLWAASTTELLLFSHDVLKRKWDFSPEGNFLHDVFIDSHQNLWLSQAGNSNVLIMTDSLEIKRIPVPIFKQSEINLVREGPRGMYVGASGINGYLFFKGHREAAFRNISLPVNFSIESDFNIHDIAVQDSVLWIASTEGLLRYDHITAKRIDLGDVFTNFSVSSVEVLDRRNILFANSYGLFRYDIQSGDYWLYDEGAGLPSNTITDHGIFVDLHKRLWVGTSFGLAIAVQPVTNSTPTAKPFCTDARVNGSPKPFVHGLHAPYGAFINLHFSPITFPENKITLQWRWGTHDPWRVLKNDELSLTDLSSGEHTLQVRAKKNTGQGWSEPTVMSIVIEKPYWQRVEFAFFILLFCILIAWISYTVTSRILRKRKQYLEILVHERTQDLQKANEELTLRNNELDRFVYSASHDLSAPLKSVLGLITVARMDNPDEMHKQYLTMMERSVRKLEEFIQEVVSYSRNTRMPLKIEPCVFEEVVRGLLLDHQYSPNYDKIDFQIEDSTGRPMKTDITRIRIILNNLISNAIKFHRFNRGIALFVKISLSESSSRYTLIVQDNGSGIEAMHLAHIFEMFYRASEQSQGSGLGLYILKESVAKLGGTVEARSKLDEGTTVTIILPVP